MATKLDQEFVRAILGKNPLDREDMCTLIREVERLETYCGGLEQKLAVAREALDRILKSKALKEAPFYYYYSEAIPNAKEALAKIRSEG